MFRLDTQGGVFRLTIDRPEVRNAIPLAGWDEGAAKVAEAVEAGARVLVIAGSGGAFSAGADLSDFPALAEGGAAPAAFRAAMRRLFEAIETAPIPAIALIEGSCYGAAVALALACDLRLAARAARFAITPAKMGIAYPQRDIARLVALLGRGAAARLLFTGDAIDAAEAKRIGLVDGDAAELAPILEALLANDRDSLATLKRGLSLAARGIDDDAAQDGRFDALFAAPSLAARLAARRRR
jgi:enoyl-CoA hydratase/carnithine racemase